MPTRREFLKLTLLAGIGVLAPAGISPRVAAGTFHPPAITPAVAVAMGALDAAQIPKYTQPLVIPPVMPRTAVFKRRAGKQGDYYEIAVRQFQQQVLPAPLPPTTVWGYGSANHPGTFNFPSFTIEAKWRSPVRIKWINDLKDAAGNFLPHLLPVDQTLHWANPGGTVDSHGMSQAPYTGPVPIVTHVHGAHTHEESDGYAEAWYLPDARNLGSFASYGSHYDEFRTKFLAKTGINWAPGSATFEYPNDQRAGTLWYHDHTLGMTRLNVYAGPAGFYLIRGGPDDEVMDSATKLPAVLPGPAPKQNGTPGMKYFEIPIAIQDRAFNEDGSLFYPDNRAFFEGLAKEQLQIPFYPEQACDGQMSDIAPIWNPEFFGNVIVVNGRAWPFLEVEPRRYRLRLLNGCNSRFLILRLSNGGTFWQIGSEGGFLPNPVPLTELLMAPAERADVIVDFAGLPAGTTVEMLNFGPDEPFGGGVPGVNFTPADPNTTGKVMQFRVVGGPVVDPTTPPARLLLPAITPLPSPSVTRRVALIELDSQTVRVSVNNGNVVLDCDDGEAFGPAKAVLGTFDAGGTPSPRGWDDPITENPALGATEVWEIFNYTMDAHPIHIHEVMFQVVGRQPFDATTNQPTGVARPPEAWETGFKDTVIAYPGEVTRVKATFDLPGLYVWHCHIVEHEDHEMMRPYRVGP